MKKFENPDIIKEERDLINKLKSEDKDIREKAQNEFYKKYHPLVLSTISKLFKFPSEKSQQYMEIQELVQEVFHKAFKSIHAFEQKSKISTWLCKISLNTYRNYYKSKSPFFIKLPIENWHDKTIFSNPQKNLLIKEILENMGGVLPSRTHQVAKLHYFKGKTREEIGKILNISEGTVHNCLTEFKNILTKEFLNQENPINY